MRPFIKLRKLFHAVAEFQDRTHICLRFYLIVYAGFVFLNAFAPEQMEATPIAGLNIAILYGFALIIGAIVLSGIYGFLCRESSVPKSKEPRA